MKDYTEENSNTDPNNRNDAQLQGDQEAYYEIQARLNRELIEIYNQRAQERDVDTGLKA